MPAAWGSIRRSAGLREPAGPGGGGSPQGNGGLTQEEKGHRMAPGDYYEDICSSPSPLVSRSTEISPLGSP